ncbi:MAG TPA: nuclear transport factor 2 family protein [Ardenticatenaceae bacterium]|nr:nuclear transport factor 2 family protein [Ardenticatenaceae bacterium]
MPDLDEILDRHVDAFNAKDLADFVADYAPDAVVEIGSRTLQGTVAIRDHFARAFLIDPTVRLQIVERHRDGLRLDVEWVGKRGRRVLARGHEEYHFDGEGRICLQRTVRGVR